MAKLKATQGPYFVDGRFVRSGFRKRLPICEVPEGGIIHTQKDAANAHLLAASWEMYQALKEVAGAFILYSEDRGALGKKVIAALRKAEGHA